MTTFRTYLSLTENTPPTRFGAPCKHLGTAEARIKRLAPVNAEVRVLHPDGTERLYAVVCKDGDHLHLKAIDGLDHVLN